MDAVEGRPLSVGPPRLARRGRITRRVARPLRRAGARRRALPEWDTWPGARGLAGREAWPGSLVLARDGLARREGIAWREGLAWPHPPLGWHGRLRRPTGLARRWSPTGARPRGRVRSGRISGPRWSGPHMVRREPRFARAAARSAARSAWWCAVRSAWWCATRGRRAKGLASTPGRLGPHGPLRAVESGGPGRVRGAWRARVAGNVDQATWRIHAGRLQYPSPLPARPRGRRRPVPVTSGPPATRPSGPGKRENQQGH
jgi:hypothetical protein